MGDGRALDGQVGRVAMTCENRLLIRVIPAACVTVFIVSALSACTFLATVTGVVAGVATGTITSNPVVGVGVAIAVKSGFEEAGNYVARKSQEKEQDAIAAAAGATGVGERSGWVSVHGIMHRVVHGEVVVTRTIVTPLALCKEMMFSVARGASDSPAPWFTATACKNGADWRWALPEPSTARWGSLQ